MSRTPNFRFDDIQRAERYYTATVFPAFLMHHEWAGLRAFLEVLESKSRGARDQAGRQLKVAPGIPDVRPETVELITEFHISRDLTAAGVTLATPSLPSGQDTPGGTTPEVPVRQDVPDVVIVLGNQLVVCEGKFFGLFTLATLNRQLSSQRRQIKLLFQARQELEAYRHVALLPIPLADGAVDCDAVFTWGELADLSDKVLGPEHYVSQRLRAGDTYHQKLTGPIEPGSGVQGQISLDEALDRCRKATRQSPVWIGFAGGTKALMNRTIAELRARPWKWRTSLDGAVRSNWLRDKEFVKLVESLLAGTRPQQSVSRWDDGLTLDQVLHSCTATNHECFVGFYPGRQAFAHATLEALQNRRRWKLHDPRRHASIKLGSTWIPCSTFARRVSRLRGLG